MNAPAEFFSNPQHRTHEAVPQPDSALTANAPRRRALQSPRYALSALRNWPAPQAGRRRQHFRSRAVVLGLAPRLGCPPTPCRPLPFAPSTTSRRAWREQDHRSRQGRARAWRPGRCRRTRCRHPRWSSSFRLARSRPPPFVARLPAGARPRSGSGPVARLALRGRCLEVSVPWRGRLALDLGVCHFRRVRFMLVHRLGLRTR